MEENEAAATKSVDDSEMSVTKTFTLPCLVVVSTSWEAGRIS